VSAQAGRPRLRPHSRQQLAGALFSPDVCQRTRDRTRQIAHSDRRADAPCPLPREFSSASRLPVLDGRAFAKAVLATPWLVARAVCLLLAHAVLPRRKTAASARLSCWHPEKP